MVAAVPRPTDFKLEHLEPRAVFDEKVENLLGRLRARVDLGVFESESKRDPVARAHGDPETNREQQTVRTVVGDVRRTLVKIAPTEVKSPAYSVRRPVGVEIGDIDPLEDVTGVNVERDTFA